MRITYDGRANAAYIYLQPTIGPGGVKKTYVCEVDREGFGGNINLDFDASRRLIGIEVLEASMTLPPELLKGAEIIG